MKEGLQEVYRSVVDYHNSLVNMRFTVAGLYLAGSAFLVNALFSNHQWWGTKITVCLLGLALTLIVFIIEARTRNLLENLGEFGGKIEEDEPEIEVKGIKIKGFFGLMKKQPIQPSLKLVTHTNGLYLLYSVFLVFWIAMWGFFAEGFALLQYLICNCGGN